MSSNNNSANGNDLPVAAIDYSPSSNEELPLASHQPHPPRNFQDLLRYSTEAANAFGQGAPAHPTRPLDEESKKFLEEALKSMTVDVIEELLKRIEILKTAGSIPENGDPGPCEEALDYIFDFVDNLDVANDFHKIGGFCVIEPCLESVHSSLKWRGAELVAELCQNNPYCQNKVLEMKLMPKLLRMIDTDKEEVVRIKALYAVSCLTRDSEEGMQEFIDSDGISVLLRSLQSDIQKLNIKSAFLLTSLCHWRPQIKDDLISMGYIEQLICQLDTHIQTSDEEHPSSVEHLLRAILAIVEDFQPAIDICRIPELQFKKLLEYIIQNSEDDQYREEYESSKILLKIVFEKSEDSDEER